MRCIDSKLSALLALSLAACSLVVDFPPLPPSTTPTPHRDGGPPPVTRDGAVAVPPAGDGAVPSTTCNVANNDNCDGNQLCCDRTDGKGPVCIDTTGDECTACGAACTDDKAPNCAARKCECEAGSGQPCGNGQRCTGVGAAAHCVECMADADCAARADGKHQCVANACVECDRGPLVNNYSDDQGCPPNKPICSASNACTACSVSPNNCGAMMQCDLVIGCTGCTSGVPVGQNGCGGTSPVCGTISTGGSRPALQCRKCTTDNECTGGYCVEQTGECSTTCDPDKLPGANHCPAAAEPICKSSTVGYSCSPCTAAADCAGVTGATRCATQGALSGQCVGCRNNNDCSRTPETPVCSATGTCRARDGNDCSGFTPRFEPTSKACVECLPASQAVDCALSLIGPACTSKFTCGECNTDAQCTTADARVCNVNTNRCTSGCKNDNQCPSGTHCDQSAGSAGACVACTRNADCPASTPICSSNTCVACMTNADCASPTSPICSPSSHTCVGCSSDAECSRKNSRTPACITSTGACVACTAPAPGAVTPSYCGSPTPACNASTNTCVTCIVDGDIGCSGTKQCAGGTACNECELGTNAGCTGRDICTQTATKLMCVTPPTPSDAGT